MARKVFHIVPADDGWALKSEGNPSPVATYSTQREAIDEGRKMATDDPDEVDLIIHRTNGTIRERLSFGETAQGSSQPTGSAPTPDRTNRFSPPAEGTQTVIAPNTNRTDNDRDRPQRVGPEDLVSVGTRVSWGAIVAGVVVALAFQVLMGMLALACGLSMSSAVSGETLTLTPSSPPRSPCSPRCSSAGWSRPGSPPARPSSRPSPTASWSGGPCS